MQAIVYHKFGSETELVQEEVATPKAGSGEVLIRISHSSVNPVDWKIREGYLASLFPHNFPIIPGWDVSGKVAGIGQDVSDFSLGDEVFAYARLPEVGHGTYAEYIALPANMVALKPQNISLAEAGATPLVGLTAYQLVHDIAAIKSTDRVLIAGGAGSVGSFAVQFAKLLGAHVTAIASESDFSYLKKMGADSMLDYHRTGYLAEAKDNAPQGFDVVLDLVGGSQLAAITELLAPEGRLVSIVDSPSRGIFHFVTPSGKQLGAIAKLFASGSLKVPKMEIRNVKQAAKAMQDSQTGKAKRKIALEVNFA